MDWKYSCIIIGILATIFIYTISRMDANQKQTNERLNALEHWMNTCEAKVKNTASTD